MKILVTGAAGFVGAHLIKELQTDKNNEIYGAVYNGTSDLSSSLRVDHILAGDLTNYDFALDLVQKTQPDLIYHLAAISVVGGSEANALKILEANTAISFNMLEATRVNTPSAKFIAICSANGYGAVKQGDLPIKETAPFRPLNPYAVSKVTQEMLALQYHLSYGMNVIILRPFNHTGIGQTTDFVIPALAKQFVSVERGETTMIEVGNLDTTRDFTDVRDMVKAYVMASTKCESGEAYNIGTGQGHTIKEIIDIFQKVSGITPTLSEKSSLTRSSDVPVLIADIAKFTAATGWAPQVSLETTISDILNYYRLGYQKGLS